jgi:hypothetical protein
VSDVGLRDAYLAWTRRALAALALPLVLTAAVQAASASDWWTGGPPSAGEVRFLFVAVAAAAVVMGRTHRARDTARRPLATESLIALSWRLVTFALAPVVIGAVLAFMTRSVADYYLLLVFTLVGIGILYPRFDQWTVWSSAPEGQDA